MTTDNLTLFSFGYYGWGSHTPRLVEAVDAAEKARGFLPPLFVDIRIRRAVRAKGFQGAAFANLLGPERHRWMKSLGNKFIETRTGPGIQIADPATVHTLLDLGAEAAEEGRRLLYFCGCQWPRRDGEINCHRTTVGQLLLQAAHERGISLDLMEWPGGEPAHIELPLSPALFTAVQKGRMTIPAPAGVPLSAFAGLPWGSIVTLRSAGDSLHRVVGPATWWKECWCLPILFLYFDPDVGIAEYEKEAAELRRSFGLTLQFHSI